MVTATVQPLKFAGSYRYAQANGFQGTHGEYIDYQYACYGEAMHRCGIEPATFAAWYAAQVH